MNTSALRSSQVARLLTVLLTLTACGGTPVPSWEVAPDTASFKKVQAAWTRSGELYEHFEGRLFVSATWISPAFAKRYAQQRAERMGLDQPSAEAEIAQAVANASEQAQFIIHVVTQTSRWNNMDRPSGGLRPQLFINGIATQATSIKRLSFGEIEDERPFFPFISPLGHVYRVQFPQPTDRSRVILRIAGPPAGRLDLEWKTRP